MSGQGWVKLHRLLLGSSTFHNEKLLKVFVWCILKASHCEHEQQIGRQKVKLKPGEFVYGRFKAAEELDMKESTVRDYMEILKNRQTITIKSTNKYSVVSLVNWAVYQSDEEKPDSKYDSKPDNKKTTNGQQKDTNNNGNTGENGENEAIPYREIIDYLNQKAGTSYKPSTKVTREHIHARWDDGFRLDDFKRVIDNKVAKWLGDERNSIYLRPITLFGTKFESYLNEQRVDKPRSSLDGMNIQA